MRLYVILCLAGLFAAGCTKDDETVDYYLAQELVVYFDTFEREAAARGLDVSAILSETGGTVEVLDAGIGGQCRRRSDGARRIVINRAYWETADAYRREFLVFHELGHCVLDREHLDTERPNGMCVSVMHSGAGGCRNAYGAATRAGYLDELFEE